MQSLLDNPQLAAEFGLRGYIQASNGNVPSIDKHVAAIENIYIQAIKKRVRIR
jgi:hypothetical protein